MMKSVFIAAKHLVARFAIAVWAIGLSVIIAFLMVGHWVTLPRPESGRTFPAASLASTNNTAEARVRAFHFLYGDCPCSRRVLRRVIERSPVPGSIETIVLVGEDPENEKLALEKGFSVDIVTPDNLRAKYGVDAAPLLIVTDLEGAIRYSGGYTSRKQGLDVQDEKMIRSLVQGDSIEELPVYGCAVSKDLQSIVDPFNLKY